jgi:hypothetical protein
MRSLLGQDFTARQVLALAALFLSVFRFAFAGLLQSAALLGGTLVEDNEPEHGGRHAPGRQPNASPRPGVEA